MKNPAPPWRASVVIALLLLCAIAHFLIPHHRTELHEFLFKATYVPIILASLWFGLRAGLVVSILTSVLYLVHVSYQLGGHLLTANLGNTLDIVLYNGIAIVTGLLSQGQVNARRRAERLAAEQSDLRRQLETSYQSLRRRTEELLDTEKQLHHAERLATLGELTASIAHEVRNPLSGIRGAADVVARADVTPAVRTEFAEILRKETDRLNQAVQNILDFSRLQQSQLVEAEIREIAQRVVTLIAREAQQQGVAIVQEVPSGIRCQCDPMLIEHILLNLLLNGVQAAPQNGKVTLSAKAEGDRIFLVVRDDGAGVPAEIRDRIFTPFFTTKPNGTGLGLAIARRIAQGMGGDVRLSSADGPGAEFTLELPARMAAPSEADVLDTKGAGI